MGSRHWTDENAQQQPDTERFDQPDPKYKATQLSSCALLNWDARSKQVDRLAKLDNAVESSSVGRGVDLEEVSGSSDECWCSTSNQILKSPDGGSLLEKNEGCAVESTREG